MHDSECDKTVPTNDEPCKTNVFGWFLNVDQAGAPGPASTSGPRPGHFWTSQWLPERLATPLRQYLEPEFVLVAALGLPLLWVCAGPQQSAAPSDSISSLGATACSKVSSGHTSPRRVSPSFQMMDANQRWDVPEAVEWMAKLAEFKPLWIEEPTSPDDILGHSTISKVKNLLLLLEWWSQILRFLGLYSLSQFCLF